MDLETALKFVNSVLKEKSSKSLRIPEIIVFRGTWQGMTYENMASLSTYSPNYLMRDVAPKLWKLLSATFEESIGKTNLRVKISSIYNGLEIKPQKIYETQIKSISPIEDWGSSPVVPASFSGREQELDTMQQWIKKDRCQVIRILGLSGVGKTLIMKRLGEQIKSKYQVIIWRSLLFRPSLTDLIKDLLQSGFGILEENNSKLLSGLMAAMRSYSCLIMLDSVEAILQPHALSKNYLPGYEDYHEFFQILGKSSHQSCVIITSLENYDRQINSNDYPIRTLKLLGLSTLESKYLLRQENLANKQTKKRLVNLIEYYQGNPSVSSFIVQIIEELFNGETEKIFEQNFLVTGEIDRLLLKSCNRLSELELEVLYWLGSEFEPVSLEEIKASIPFYIDIIELFEAVESLRNRSLVVAKNINQESFFVLSPVIREFVTNQFIAQIKDDTSLRDRVDLLSNSNTVELGTIITPPTQLSNWFKGKYTSDWQSIKALLDSVKRSPLRLKSIFNLRDKKIAKRLKKIKLKKDDNLAFLLLIAISHKESIFNITIQLQPNFLQDFLLDKIQMSLMDPREKILATVKSNSKDSFIQLPYFKASEKDKFKIIIQLNSNIYQEEFVI